MEALLNALGDVVSGAWSVIQWVVNLLGTLTAPLQAFLTGSSQLFISIMDAFSSVSGTPFFALSLVAVVGVGYVIIRIVIHLL